MLGHLHAEQHKPVETGQNDAADAQPSIGTTAGRAGRTELRIDSATIIDAQQERDLINAGNVIAASSVNLRSPVRLRVTVGGSRAGQELRAAIWFRRKAEPG